MAQSDDTFIADDDTFIPDEMSPLPSAPTFMGEMGKGLTAMGSHFIQGFDPIAIGKSILLPGEAMEAQMQKGEEAFRSGRRVEGVARTAAASVPIVGPLAAGLVESSRSMMYGTTEEAGGAMGDILSGAVLAKVTPSISKGIGKRFTSETSFPPKAAINRLANALNAEGNDIQHLRRALPDIHAEAVRRGLKTNVDLNRLAELGEHVANKTWEEHVTPELKRYGGITPPDTAQYMFRNMMKNLDAITLKQNPNLINDVNQVAGSYDRATLGQMQQRISTLDKQLAAYFQKDIKGKSTIAQISPLKGFEVSEVNALRDLMVDELTRLTGKDFKQVRNLYGSVAHTRDLARQAAQDYEATAAKEAGRSLPQKALELLPIGPFAKHRMLRAGARVYENPNRRVAAAFKAMGEKAAPTKIRSGESFPTARGLPLTVTSETPFSKKQLLLGPQRGGPVEISREGVVTPEPYESVRQRIIREQAGQAREIARDPQAPFRTGTGNIRRQLPTASGETVQPPVGERRIIRLGEEGHPEKTTRKGARRKLLTPRHEFFDIPPEPTQFLNLREWIEEWLKRQGGQ